MKHFVSSIRKVALLCVSLAAIPLSTEAAANLVASSSATFADAGRSCMDIGGVWNGTIEVTTTTGDTFSFNLSNTAGSPALTNTAHNLALAVRLPTGFFYVTGTAAGIPGIGASQVGSTVTFTIPGGTTIAPGSAVTVNFGLRTSTTVSGGTFQLNYTVNYTTVSSGGTVQILTSQQNVLVCAGATTISKIPNVQTKAVSQVATWNVLIKNTGLGGLFDVVLDESAIDPGNSLDLLTITQSSPSFPTAIATAARLTLPYLETGETFAAVVTASVTACSGVFNSVYTTDRTTATFKTQTADVIIDLQQPLIDFTSPSINLNYSSATNISMDVINTGLGNAVGVTLETDLLSLPLTVSNVGGGWTYNAASGTFVLGGTGSIPVNSTSTLTFSLQATNVCTFTSAATLVFTAKYTDICLNDFNTPTKLLTVSPPGSSPSLDLDKEGDSRVEVGQSSTWTVHLTVSNTFFFQTDPLIVRDVLPTGITGVNITAPPGTTATCSGACVAGSTITWTVPLSVANGTNDLDINFTAPSDPCLGGSFLVNTASVTATTTSSCTLSGLDQSSILLINNATSEVVQNFNISSPSDGMYETGAVDNGNGVRNNPNEGEFISSTATYAFPGGASGNWIGSTYQDDFGGLAGQTMVPGSLFVYLNGSTTPVAVPSGSITSSTGSLSITLDFLAGGGFLGANAVAGSTVSIAYQSVAQDSDIPLPDSSRSETSIVTLTLSGGSGGGICGTGNTFKQGDFYVIGRAEPRISVSVPSVINVCESFSTTLSDSLFTVEYATNVRHVLISTGAYSYPTGQTPTYGGLFSSGNMLYAENAGINPTYDFLGGELTAAGTIAVNVRRKAGTGTSNTPLQARIDYDDNETSLTGARDFQSFGSGSPSLVRKANISLVTTPQTVTVTSTNTSITFYVTNTGNGTAYGSTLTYRVPNGLIGNSTASNAANPSYPVTISGSTMTWSLGNIPAGNSVTIEAFLDVDGSVCSITSQSNTSQGVWGCDTSTEQVVNQSDPTFYFPEGELQVLHDSVASSATLCGTTYDTLIVRNVGSTHLYNVEAFEVINPAVTGLTFVNNSVQISTNSGVTWVSLGAGGNPSGAGTTGDPYHWTSTQISQLADLVPQTESGVFEVRIRLQIQASELTNSADLTLDLSGSAEAPCGASITNSEGAFILPLAQPDITVDKVGKNVTRGDTSYSDSVSGATGDVIEWKVTITNSGDLTAQNVRFADVFAGSGGSATLTGPGHAGTVLANNTPVTIPDIVPSTSVVYLVSETLGAACVNADNTVDVTWGCVDNGANVRSNLTSPTDNTDTAGLSMLPNFSNSSSTQTFTALSGGRTLVSLTFNNTGGKAQALVVTNTLPAGQQIDLSSAPWFVTTGSVTAIGVAGTVTVPIFNLTGSLYGSELVTINFITIQTGSFDTTFDPLINPETVGNGLDPTPPATGNNQARIDYESSCGNAGNHTTTVSLDPKTPDVDIAVSPTSQVVVAGSTYTYIFTLTNNGDSGSIADNIVFTLPTVGGAWSSLSMSVTTPGTGGSGGACTISSCTAAQIGTLSSGQSAVIQIGVTANDNGSSLALIGQPRGTIFLSSGTTTGNDYSLDQGQPKVVGVSVDKSLVSTSESFTSTSTVAIGEEATWRLTTRWFGGIAISTITVRDTLPSGLGYVSHSTNPAHNVTISNVSGNTPVTSGVIDFTIANFSGSGTFDVNMVQRVLNIAGNTNGASLINNLDIQFNAYDTTFASNDPGSGFGGSNDGLHTSSSVVVGKPSLSFDKQIRNVTNSGSFGSSALAGVGDTLEYKILVTNAGSAPAFDFTINDTLQTSKLLMISGASDGVDNDGDGVVDDATEGSYVSGAGGSAVFVDTNTVINSTSPYHDLGRLDPTQSLTLLYRATVDISATPSDLLNNLAGLTASSLPGLTGSQTSPTGSSGSGTGEQVFTSSDTASANISSATLTKSLVTTSINNDNSSSLVIGEEARFRITTVLPSGTAPNFKVYDTLPEGLALIETPAVSIGGGISPNSQPTITPSSLPTTSTTTVIWDFGTLTISSTAVPSQRTISIDYVTRVRDIPGNAIGGTLVNSSSYSFTGSPVVTPSSVTITIIEPQLGLNKTLQSSPNVIAGSTVNYRITVTNSGTGPAFNTVVQDTLPSGMRVSTPTLTSATINGSTVSPVSLISTAYNSTTGIFQFSLPDSLVLNASGQTLVINYNAFVDSNAGGGLTLTNSARVTEYYSLPSSSTTDRRQYAATPTSGVSVNTPIPADLGKSVSPSTHNLGEPVVYTIRIPDTVIGIPLYDARLTDTISNSLTISTITHNGSGLSGGGCSSVSVTNNTSGNNLDLTFSCIPASTQAVISVTVLAKDIGGNVASTGINNQASFVWAPSPGGSTQTAIQSGIVTSTITEPSLRLALDGPSSGNIPLGSTGTFVARVTNSTGSFVGAAYQPVVQIQIPSGMRNTNPTSYPISASISGGRTVTLTQGTDFTLSYSTGTGVLSVSFISAAGFVDVTETMLISFAAALDNETVNGSSFTLVGTVTQYKSYDTSSGATAEIRTYSTALGTGSLGTSNGALGDDPTDDTAITTLAPSLAVSKAVDLSSINLATERTLHYAITVINSGTVVTAPSIFSDDLGAFANSQYFEAGTLTNVTVSSNIPSGYTNNSNASGGTNGKGLVQIENVQFPIGSSSIEFDIDVAFEVPDQTIITNQATITVPGFSTPFVTNVASTTVNSNPLPTVQKYSVDVNGGSLLPGEVLGYTIVVQNRGGERMLNSVLTDGIPANTTYVPNSTTLNGLSVNDSSGTTPLTGGMSVNTPLDSTGTVRVCPSSFTTCSPNHEVLVSFQVQISSNVSPGTLIQNQAIFTATGEGTGREVYTLSDDTSTVPSPDPTIDIVGGGPYLEAEKTVTDQNGGTLSPTEDLLYTITVHNRGDEAASGVQLVDQIPSSTTYIASSMQFDTDSSTNTTFIALTDASDSDQGDFNVTTSSALTITIGGMPAGAEIVIRFRVNVNAGVPDGTVLSNQGIIRATGLPDKRTDGDNSHSNGDQPTLIVVGSNPFLRQTKQVFDVNGGFVQAGDTLEYLIQTFNIGASSATNVVITDTGPVPSMIYVASSTKVNGTVITDVPGPLSALTAGINVGAIPSGSFNLIQFRVQLPNNIAAGTVIDNQASFTANGGLSGVSDSDLDDGLEGGNDPLNPNDDDPTRVQVGGAQGSANLSGFVWIDLDHDRVYDAGEEEPQSGWTVEVLQDGVLVDSKVTDSNGFYRFTNLIPGSGYQVRFRHPISGVVYGRAVTEDTGANTTDGTIRGITLSSGENSLNNNLPLDPSGVIYDSVRRIPVAGAQVFIDGPSSFDPVAHLLPGQFGQVTGSDGRYRFDINFAAGAPFGEYVIRIISPTGYISAVPTSPSVIIPPASSVGCGSSSCFDVPASTGVAAIQLNNDLPTGSEVTTYYLRFVFDSLLDANVVNNHIPLDPSLDNAITVIKTSPMQTVTRGDLVPYVIKAINNFSSVLEHIDLLDLIPPGFKYVKDSATLNDQKLEPTVNARQLKWRDLTFAASETKTFKMILIIGAGVGEGNYKNSAWAENNVIANRVSNIGDATVQVVPDATFDCPEVIGKVFYDVNANGYQDQDELGVPGVRIASLRGWLVTTDSEGRYHIACPMIPDPSRGSNFLLKVDPRTIPTGYRFTTENPRDAHLTRGKTSKINFGIGLYRVVRLDLARAAFEKKWDSPTRKIIETYYETMVDSTSIPPINFAVAKFQLEEEHIVRIREALEKVKKMENVENVRLRVVGHTDSDPIIGNLAKTIPNNWVLSQNRANTMAGILKERLSLSEEMIETEGRADTQPVASNKTAEGKAKNRRAEVEVVYEIKKQRSKVQTIESGEPAPEQVTQSDKWPWERSLDQIMPILKKRPSVLRIAYCQENEDQKIARQRIRQVSKEVRARWKKDRGQYPLVIEEEISFAGCREINRIGVEEEGSHE